jgi:hypothetical protein
LSVKCWETPWQVSTGSIRPAAVSASGAAVGQRPNRNAEAAADYGKALPVFNSAGPDAQALRQTLIGRCTTVCKPLHRNAPPAAFI